MKLTGKIKIMKYKDELINMSKEGVILNLEFNKEKLKKMKGMKDHYWEKKQIKEIVEYYDELLKDIKRKENG